MAIKLNTPEESPGRGRPTKLDEELIQRARGYKEPGPRLPTVAALARHLGIARSTVYEWCKANGDDEHDALASDFSDIVEELLAEQEIILVNKGLSGEYNSNIVKLMLSGKHGYVEKSGVEHTGGLDNKNNTKLEMDETMGEKFVQFVLDQTKGSSE